MVKYSYNFDTEKLDLLNTPGDFNKDFLELSGSNQSLWSPTTTVVNNLNSDMLDGHHWSEVPSSGGQYEANFLIADWSGSVPFEFHVPAGSHLQGATKHLHVTVKRDLGSVNEIVYDSPTIADNGDVTLYSNLKYDGNVQIGKLGGIGTSLINASVGCSFDGIGSALQSGLKAFTVVPYNCTIKAWSIIGDQTGNLVIDVWKANNAIPTAGSTITGTEKPTLTSQQLNSDINLTTWTTDVSINDVIGFNIESCSSITKASVILKVEKS